MNEASFEKLSARPDLEQATFAGGCFWCIEAPFEHKDGVVAAISGYTGGTTVNPSYEQVHSKETGHREAVRIFFDPQQISYQALLDIFWLQIDPTDPGGQFADRGRLYTTAIYYHSSEQRALAENSKQKLEVSRKYDLPITTAIEPAQKFYPATEEHQNFSITNADYYKKYKVLSGRAEFIEKNS
jgi:methionine-S-sulfoxide reductase